MNFIYFSIFRGNIEGNDMKSGQEIVPYIRAFPPKGTGYHRHIFVLYKQEKKLDFSEFKISADSDLEKRTFQTLDFYRKFQDDLTPAGLSFFQSDYDESVRDFFHETLSKIYKRKLPLKLTLFDLVFVFQKSQNPFLNTISRNRL